MFGAALALAGFDEWGEVHRMFHFDSFRLLLTFCTAVGVSAAGLWLLGSRSTPQARAFHKGLVPGSVLFGMGWALTGACPAIALAVVGGGQLFGLVTLAGIACGTWLFGVLQPHFFRWDTGSCEV